MRETIACAVAFALIRRLAFFASIHRAPRSYIYNRSYRAAYSIIKRVPFISKERKERFIVRCPRAPRVESPLRFLSLYDRVLSLFGVKPAPINKPLKLFFCRPLGGLGDILCTINRCAVYALRYRRVIYIDGTKSGFLDDFSRYFSIKEGGGGGGPSLVK
ncbi:MAG: hypothetical protein LBI57_00080 [Helicobacteraceae bacterium]|jgi:hypothetical protein|nr:hypothetical protein [Helicobacteraceae bacterium]